MSFELRVASRKKAKLRVGLSAPSGAGKTYSALLIAKGIAGDWSKVALIDTENGSGELYSHLGGYNVINLEAPYTPERYIQAINACEAAGMKVIVIDSATHEWDGEGGCLQIVEKLGGRYQDWGKVTPRHQKFIETIVSSSCHIITTTRRKQDYAMSTDQSGKTKVEKLGMKEVQRDGFEYELTLAFEIDIRHNTKASKDRTGLFMDQPEFVITEDTGKTLIEWAESGEEDTTEIEKADLRIKISNALKDLEKNEEWLMKQLGKSLNVFDVKKLGDVLGQVEGLVAKKKAKEAEIERQRKEEGRASAEEEAALAAEGEISDINLEDE